MGFQRRAQSSGGPAGRMFGRGAGDIPPVPRERRGATVRRIVAFFRPYKGQVAVVLVAILFTSLIGLVNPILLKLLIDIAIPERDWGLLNLFVGLMIVLPIVSGLIGAPLWAASTMSSLRSCGALTFSNCPFGNNRFAVVSVFALRRLSA